MNKILTRLQRILAERGVFLYGNDSEDVAEKLDLRQAEGRTYGALYLPRLFGRQK